jgi:hypothetical protein
MKKLLIILLAFVCISTQAQNWKKGLAIVGYHTATVCLGAVADAQFDMGNKPLAHTLHAVEIGAVLGGPFIFKPHDTSEILAYMFSYMFLRFSFYDVFYNWQRDLPINYVGNTSHYDRFFAKMPPDGRMWWKSCSLIVGFAIPIKSF